MSEAGSYYAVSGVGRVCEPRPATGFVDRWEGGAESAGKTLASAVAAVMLAGCVTTGSTGPSPSGQGATTTAMTSRNIATQEVLAQRRQAAAVEAQRQRQAAIVQARQQQIVADRIALQQEQQKAQQIAAQQKAQQAAAVQAQTTAKPPQGNQGKKPEVPPGQAKKTP